MNRTEKDIIGKLVLFFVVGVAIRTVAIGSLNTLAIKSYFSNMISYLVWPILAMYMISRFERRQVRFGFIALMAYFWVVPLIGVPIFSPWMLSALVWILGQAWFTKKYLWK